MVCTQCKGGRLVDMGGWNLCSRCNTAYVAGGLTFSVGEDPLDDRPDVPERVAIADIVFDHYIDYTNKEAFLTSRVYCPKEEVKRTVFDPNDPTFQAGLKKHRARFKNRRRYRYEKEREAREAQGVESAAS